MSEVKVRGCRRGGVGCPRPNLNPTDPRVTCAVTERVQLLFDVPSYHGTSTPNTTAAMLTVTAERVIGEWCLSSGLCITIAAAAVESHSSSSPLPTSMAVADVEVSEEL